MRAFIVVKKDKKLLDGKVDFRKLGEPTLYYKLEDAFAILPDKNHSVMEFEFLDDEEVLEAVSAAICGSVWQIFSVKWVTSYDRTNLKDD